MTNTEVKILREELKLIRTTLAEQQELLVMLMVESAYSHAAVTTHLLGQPGGDLMSQYKLHHEQIILRISHELRARNLGRYVQSFSADKQQAGGPDASAANN